MIDDFKELSSTMIDFSKYKSNNWLKTDTNKTLNDINALGGAIWLNIDGDLCYRVSNGGKIVINTRKDKAKIVLSSFVNRSILLLNGTKEQKADFTIHDIFLVQREEFNPYVNNEFHKIEGQNFYIRNSFKPSKYLKLPPSSHKEPTAILKLINHLANGDDYRKNYIVNWLAYFFQNLKKSQVALVLRGQQGAGKGVLFDEVIKPLFGAEYCIQINDRAIEGNFLGGIVEGKLFYNLDEISHNIAGNKNNKNFLKALVTNDSITTEKKNINMEKETKLFGQVIITSNEPYALEVEPNDRRYTIFTTGNNIKKVDFLGYGTYSNLLENISKELKDFSLYLKSFKVDNSLANQALDTKEKKALVNATTDTLKLFADAIENKKLEFFEELEEDSFLLFDLIQEDFSKDRFARTNIIKCFNLLIDRDIGNRTLLNKLKNINPLLFDNKNIKKSNGNVYYNLSLEPSEPSKDLDYELKYEKVKTLLQ